MLEKVVSTLKILQAFTIYLVKNQKKMPLLVTFILQNDILLISIVKYGIAFDLT